MSAAGDARARLDENIATAATPALAAVFRQERAAIEQATEDADTEAEWWAAATTAVHDNRWILALTALWISAPIVAVFTRQAAELGVPDLAMPTATRTVMTGHATDHAISVTNTTREALGRISTHEQGTAFRSSMRRQMNDLYTGYTRDRAGRIAFTETLQAGEMARYEGAKTAATRSRATIRKVWFTQGDNRVRPTHQAANGQSIIVAPGNWQFEPKKERFKVGGALLRFPRDPSGPPGEVIGCRCFTEYRRIRRTPTR